MRFEATEITPTAPTAMNDKVRLSSPERTWNPLGHAATSWLTRSTDPPASFIATMFLQSAARRAVVSTPISIPLRPGMLYRMIGSLVAEPPP